jgi:hypothetical protein
MSGQVKKCIKCNRAVEDGGLFCKYHRPSPEIHTRSLTGHNEIYIGKRSIRKKEETDDKKKND